MNFILAIGIGLVFILQSFILRECQEQGTVSSWLDIQTLATSHMTEVWDPSQWGLESEWASSS